MLLYIPDCTVYDPVPQELFDELHAPLGSVAFQQRAATLDVDVVRRRAAREPAMAIAKYMLDAAKVETGSIRVSCQVNPKGIDTTWDRMQWCRRADHHLVASEPGGLHEMRGQITLQVAQKLMDRSTAKLLEEYTDDREEGMGLAKFVKLLPPRSDGEVVAAGLFVATHLPRSIVDVMGAVWHLPGKLPLEKAMQKLVEVSIL